MSTDPIDEMFNKDLEKLGKKRPPLELQVNAAKVKAAQDPKKPGAEKPDLGAPGKGKGGIDPALKTAALEGIKSFGKLLVKNPKSAELDKAYAHAEKKTGKQRNQLSTKEILDSYNALYKTAMCGADHGKLKKGEKCPRCGKGEHMMPDGKIMKDSEHEKKAADLYSAVGVHAPEEGLPERPDVSVDDQTTDRIDDHYLSWMQERADDDVVKIAGSTMQDVIGIAAGGPKRLDRVKVKARTKGMAIGAAATAATLAAGTALYGAFQKRMANKGASKTAAVQENDENLELMERLKRRARQGLGTTNDA